MFTESQNRRLARKFTAAVARALDAFPVVLSQSEPDAAAEVIAGIIKTQLTRPSPPVDPTEALDRIMRGISDTDNEGGRL